MRIEQLNSATDRHNEPYNYLKEYNDKNNAHMQEQLASENYANNYLTANGKYGDRQNGYDALNTQANKINFMGKEYISPCGCSGPYCGGLSLSDKGDIGPAADIFRP